MSVTAGDISAIVIFPFAIVDVKRQMVPVTSPLMRCTPFVPFTSYLQFREKYPRPPRSAGKALDSPTLRMTSVVVERINDRPTTDRMTVTNGAAEVKKSPTTKQITRTTR